MAPVLPKHRREATVNAITLRRFLGEPRWSRWLRLLAELGISYKRKGQRARRLTYVECRAILELWYRQVGEYRMRKWSA